MPRASALKSVSSSRWTPRATSLASMVLPLLLFSLSASPFFRFPFSSHVMSMSLAEFMKIGLRGITLVVASGDSGVNGRTDESAFLIPSPPSPPSPPHHLHFFMLYHTILDCYSFCHSFSHHEWWIACSERHFNPDFPAASPYVTSVGATQLRDVTFNLPNPPPICDVPFLSPFPPSFLSHNLMCCIAERVLVLLGQRHGASGELRLRRVRLVRPRGFSFSFLLFFSSLPLLSRK